MSKFTEFVKRSMKIYFRDRSAIFFSLMTMLIVIGLMILFLGDMNINVITKLLGAFPGRDAAADEENAKLLILMWTCAGIIPVNAITVAVSALSPMIKDKTDGRINSICTAPVSRFTITSGYVASTCICSVIICIITLVLSEIYCVIQGAEAFSAVTHLKLIGMIAANSFTCSALMYLLSAAAKTEGAWSSIGTVIGTLVGFAGGIYLPIGTLSDAVGNVLKCTPMIYSAAMFRQIMTEDILQKTFDGTSDALISEYSSEMGITLDLFDSQISAGNCVSIVLASGIVFLLIGAVVTSLSKRTDR